MNICLFLPSGRTFTFRDIKIITHNETVLVFDYKAMSDGISKQMTVFKSSIIGYSLY